MTARPVEVWRAASWQHHPGWGSSAVRFGVGVLRKGSGHRDMSFHDDMRVSDLPEGESGLWRVEGFKIREEDAFVERLRAIQHGRGVTKPGSYTRLMRGQTVIMSDTPDELRDHSSAYYQAFHSGGQVLIAGLGLGCLLRGVLHCQKVEHVDVVEQSADVIALVGEHYEKMAADRGKSLTIHHADIFAKTWPKGTRWNVAWFDIWDDLCGDYLPEMSRLLRSYGRRADWKGCWGREILQRQERHEQRYAGW